MKLLKLYEWIAGSQNDFTRQFQNNEQLFNQAKKFWHDLDGIMIFVFMAMLVIGIGFAAYYYTIFNKHPGRRYTIGKWFAFIPFVIIATFVVSLGIECYFCSPKLDGAFNIEAKVALGNSIYGAFLYFITSIIWCGWGPTNAYRFFKFW